MSETRIIVLASRNQDKLRELQQICADLPFEVRAAADYPGLPEVIEDGTTALGNATRKALVTAGWTGEIAVADDTTFQVRTLGGLPDVFAARFAGAGCSYGDNCRLVLDLMRDVPDDGRDVRFETSMVWVDPRPSADLAPTGPHRWVHDPFANRPHSRDLAARLAADRQQVWSRYLAWFGTLPVGWGADAERVKALVPELAGPSMTGEADGDGVRLPGVRVFGADGPTDRRAPAATVALADERPGATRCGPVWLELNAEGRLLGQLLRQPLGAGGFGYDPVVVPLGHHRTLAELAPAEKNAISHRGRALRRVLDQAMAVYGLGAGGDSAG